jgi:lipase ATG15
MAALLGVTFGTPVVAFESPGEKLASTRLHLPKPVCTCLLRLVLLLTVICSRRPRISSMCIIQQTLSPWAFAQVMPRPVQLVGMLWRLSSCIFSLPVYSTNRGPLRCHLGRSIVYDTVSELGWRVYIQNHGIVPVIEIVLNGTWGPAEKEGREVPEAKFEEDCVVS